MAKEAKKPVYTYFNNRKFEFCIPIGAQNAELIWHVGNEDVLSWVGRFILVPHNAVSYCKEYGVEHDYDMLEKSAYHWHEPFVRYWLDRIVDDLAAAKFREAYANAPLLSGMSQTDKEKTRYKVADAAKAAFLTTMV